MAYTCMNVVFSLDKSLSVICHVFFIPMIKRVRELCLIIQCIHSIYLIISFPQSWTSQVKERGVYVQASTLGALEALLEFFKTNNVPYSGIRVGPVVKRDVMRAAAMLEHDPMYAVILAFDVKVEKDAQELADKVRESDKIFF